MRIALPFALPALLIGCALAPAVPEGYSGPRSTLQDSGSTETSTRVQIFALLSIDGQSVKNAIGETGQASSGKGFSTTLRLLDREIPSRPMKVKLIGTHFLAAPIHEIASRSAGTFFSVEGEVDFIPEPEASYIVTGQLSKERSCVWIMRRKDSEPVTPKVCS